MSDWNSFLLGQGVTTDTLTGKTPVSDSGFDPDNTYLIPLHSYGIVAIKGPDSAKFLQGQVTCDIRELTGHQTRLGAQCNIKGRMLLCFRALQNDPEQIFLRINNGLMASGLASLGKYIVFSKAKLADVSPDYRCIGIVGPAASNIIKKVFNITLDADNDWQAAQDNFVIRIDEQRFECWLAAGHAETQWQQLSAHAVVASENYWSLLNIQAGVGDITLETLDLFTPQAINFQLTDGISFRKGCYTGQEIVARLHYRGTLKRHMYRFEFSLQDGQLPLPGSELRNAAGKNVGEIVLAAHKRGSRGELLASVVDNERIDLYLPGNPQKLDLLPLPYAIPTPTEAE